MTRVHFEIPAVMHTFKPGHRIYHDAANPSAIRVHVLKE
ncbi:MAG: hypothetical protein JJE01_06155 [Gemmatimonadetes bacterium]|nr:hypothetical protein [Gemmatimonadota bacterium]